MSGGLYTVTIDPDRDIAFQHHTFRTGIVSNSLQLEVEMELNIVKVIIISNF